MTCSRIAAVSVALAATLTAASVSVVDGKAVIDTGTCSSLVVRVKGADGGLLGDCQVQGGKLSFTPRFPFRPGVAYEAVVAGTVLPFELAKPKTEPARVVAVYPSSDRIPDNQLKFYIQFSAPMSRGEAYKHIRLMNDRGEEEQGAFLQIDQELWNRETTRVTLLFDPGRVKRGVKPNRDDGPPLRVGEKYTFIVDSGWLDSNGNPVGADFRKQFTVVESDRTGIDTAKWSIAPPKAGTRDPLLIRFGEPLDRAMLESAIQVSGVEGDIAPRANETEWTFTPRAPWTAGAHTIEADTMLEDLAGNKIGREFDIDIKDQRERQLDRIWKKIPFRID